MDEKKEYIERGSAKRAIYEYICGHTMSKFLSRELLDASKKGAEGAMYELDYVPAAEVAPVVHGKWEASKKAFSYYHYRCSVCGCDNYSHTGRDGKVGIMRYCPNCGSKMDGERKEV